MRQTTNKNLTKQILTLMLAFVMVFTGMSIGSWGVDMAWAEGLAPSGVDGNIAWSLDSEGTLTISKNAGATDGIMADYKAFPKAPWLQAATQKKLRSKRSSLVMVWLLLEQMRSQAPHKCRVFTSQRV